MAATVRPSPGESVWLQTKQKLPPIPPRRNRKSLPGFSNLGERKVERMSSNENRVRVLLVQQPSSPWQPTKIKWGQLCWQLPLQKRLPLYGRETLKGWSRNRSAERSWMLSDFYVSFLWSHCWSTNLILKQPKTTEDAQWAHKWIN